MSGSSTTSRHRATGIAVGAVLAVVAVIGAVTWLASGTEDEPAPSDRLTGAASQEPSPSTTEPAESPTSSEPAVPSVDVRPGARRAVADGVAALVPDRLRAGWAVTEAEYDPKPGRWHLVVTTPRGRVDLYQDDSDSAALLQQYARDSTRGKPVDLRAFQLGVWESRVGEDRGAIARDLATGGAVIVADDVESAVAVAESLLTYESAGGRQD